jgi:hypothetical protein
LNRLFFPIELFRNLCKNPCSMNIRVCFWTFSCCIDVCVCPDAVPQLWLLQHCTFKIGKCKPPALFIFKIVLVILNSVHFCIHFRINLSTSAKTSAGILISFVFNL